MFVRCLVGASSFLLLAVACGQKVDTGRNNDPSTWPRQNSQDEQGKAPSALRSECFLQKSEALPQELKTVCDNELRPLPEFKELVAVICDSGHLLSALDKPHCGWDGAASNAKTRYIHRFFTQKDTSQDYEDVTSSIIRTPVTLAKYTSVVKLAFENYDEFKRQGYQWTSGTRENRNLSSTTWDEGVRYRFRADKDVYEVGYEGQIKYIQLTPTLGMHFNRATGDFERIKKFAQVVLYSQLPDQSTLTIRLEHRQTQSSGLFDLAKKSALELDFEAMEKGFSNATKK